MIGKLRGKTTLNPLQTLYNLGTIADLTDGQLLERYATDGDEVAELALAALIERHEAMVWRVCLAIVRDEHDAEDAFQATFFVLIRKVRSLWVRGSLGPWLHQVACRTASCLRRTIDRRRVHARRSAKTNAARSVQYETARDTELDAAVHDEVNRLPEKYRTPIVLCDLEGCTHQEAARFLGWPIGTVKSRQSHGRGLLRDRLVRRGLGLAVAGSVDELVKQTADARTPIELSQRTAADAMQQSARLLTGIELSSRALALTQGVVRAMLWIKMRFVCVAALAAGVVCVGASVYVRGFQEPAAKDGTTVSKSQTRNKPASAHLEASKKTLEKPATAARPITLREQELITRRAKVTYEMARSTRELAEIAVEEYQDITYPRDLAGVEGEIKLAQSELTRLENLAEKPERQSLNLPVYTEISKDLVFKRARFYLEQAQSKKKVLVDYTRLKTIKELQSEVEGARSEEMARKSIWELEAAKEKQLQREQGPKTK